MMKVYTRDNKGETILVGARGLETVLEHRFLFCRGERIRTSDLLHPSKVRQTRKRNAPFMPIPRKLDIYECKYSYQYLRSIIIRIFFDYLSIKQTSPQLRLI